jgi:hypothetical protein
MVQEPDAMTGNRVGGWQRIIGCGKKPVSHLVNDDEDDVVGRLASGPRAWHLVFWSLRCGISQVQ